MPSEYTLRCLIDGAKTAFSVIIPIDSEIEGLKERIKQKCSLLLDKFIAADHVLWKVCDF